MSVKKELPFLQESFRSSEVRVQLGHNLWIDSAGDKKDIQVDDFPIFVFLRAVGFESVILKPESHQYWDVWTQRMAEYEQIFIQDPENLVIDECVWNELDSASGEFVIQCLLPATHTPSTRQSLKAQVGLPPPFAAPLKIDPVALQKFVEEVQRQSAQETLLRIQSILREFKQDSRRTTPETWSNLLCDVLTIALESRELEKALQVARDHQEDLKRIWNDHARFLRLCGAYDAKPQELSDWASIFESLENRMLVIYLQQNLHERAGPQILKLMHARIQRDPDRMIEFCLANQAEIQKQLLPWMTPYWKLKHFTLVQSEFERAIQRGDGEGDLKLWITSLLKCAPHQALQDLERYFQKKRAFWKRDFPHVQKAILAALQEAPGSESIAYLKRWKLNVQGVLADRIERILSLYSSEQKGGNRK